MTQPSQLSFSDVAVAQRTRDIIKEIATSQVAVLGTNPQVGRVLSIDLAQLTATVWFPTDDGPVQVNMFPGMIPLDMGDFRVSGGSDTGAVGTGGLVQVETFRGRPYITRVLSGGDFQLNANFLGTTHRMFNATLQGTIQGPPITQDVYERHVNVIVNAGAGFVNGNCLLVGPWSGRNDGSSVDGVIEMTLNYWVSGSVKNQSRSYKFSISDRMIVDLEGDEGNKPFWMRILPHTNLGTNPHAELAVDVALVKTGIRTNLEFWFRLVPLDVWADQSVYFMSVKTFGSAFNVGDPRTGRLVMIKNTTTDPVQGWVGFHNAGLGWTERDEYATFNTGTWFQGDQWSSGSWRSADLRIANDLSPLWHTDGQWTWFDDTKSLFWEGNIIFTGIGPNWNGLHNGVLNVPMPSGQTIPIFPANPADFNSQKRALDAFGRIPLLPGETLYYALHPGIGSGGQGNWILPKHLFFIVDSKTYNAATYNFALPEWAIPIASRTYTLNGERKDIYIHNNNVDLHDTGTYVEVFYNTSHTGIVGGDVTGTMFTPSFRFKKKTAYRVYVKTGQSSSATGTVVLWHLRKGPTDTSPVLISFQRVPIINTTSFSLVQFNGYFVNDTAADIVIGMTLTGQGSGNNTTTWSRFADSNDQAILRIEECGPSSKYINHPKLT